MEYASNTVNEYQLNKLEATVGPTSSIMFCGVVKLYTAGKNDRKWIYSDLIGGLCFVIDRNYGGVSIF